MSASVRKYCFVTIGATASFASLIRAVLSPSFLAGLKAHRYTHLVVQYGADGASLYQGELSNTLETVQNLDVIIEGFALDQSGLGKYISLAKHGGDGKGQEGVVVSHAGNSLHFVMSSFHFCRVPYSGSVIAESLLRTIRIWQHSRRSSYGGADHCCTEPRVVGQSPGGAGRSSR